jgi:uncharacterized membrane protein YbaN (DUF454 family)
VSRFWKVILNIAGIICVCLGILGIFLPLLPATPFFLLASACFVRSSERLYNWLINNKYFGSYIRNFKDKKGMPVKAKIYTIILLWGSLSFSIYRIEKPLLDYLLIGVGIGVTLLIYKIKTLKME